MRAVRADLVAVLHVRACCGDIAHQLILRRTGRRAQFLRRAQNHIVNGVQFQLIGHGHIGAVLGDRLRHSALAELLTRRDHTLGQRARVLKRVPLAPFHGLAAAGRQRLLAGKLRMNEFWPCVFQQFRVVKRLHGRRHAASFREGICLAGIRVHIIAAGIHQRTRVSKQLQIQFLFQIHKNFSFPHVTDDAIGKRYQRLLRAGRSRRLARAFSSSLVCLDQCSGLSANAPKAAGAMPLSRGRR